MFLVPMLAMLAAVGCDKASPVAPSGSILAVSANPTRIALNGSSTITIIGRKPDGNPLNPGTEIHLSATLGSIPSIVTTNGSGTATATFQSNGRLGTARISAAIGTAPAGGGTTTDTPPPSTPTSASIDVQVGASAKTITLQPTPTSIQSTGGDVKLLAIVRDSDGQPLPNQGVNFTTDLGTLNSRGGIVNTNAQGEARDTLKVTENDLLNNATAIHVTVQSAGSDGALVSAMSTVQVVTGRPVAHFTYEAVGSDKRKIQFHNMSTGVGTLTLSWDFGDGTPPSSDQNPVHAYTTDQQYTVTLTVTDQNNNASVSSATFTIPLAAGGSSTP
ncbi:MAG TPA: PKD domain-containing protein [Thermoanaerobaculia bacterium]|nr:PKD domain-containing protein [Thermoanaerobaculia bacterium]